MSHTIKNLGIFLLIAVWLISCGNKPNDNINNPSLKDLETKEKKLLDELKPFTKDEKVDHIAKVYMADYRIFSDTPLYELQPKLQGLIYYIGELENEIKIAQVNHVDDEYKNKSPFLKDNNQDLDGLKKWLELIKATKEKYERALGIGSSTK